MYQEDIVLVERDYKGEYERFALTETQFFEEFGFIPVCSGTETLSPFVHIWFEPNVCVGDSEWETFFTDMEEGLPQSDVENGNLAYVRADLMPDGWLKNEVIKYECNDFS